MKTIKNKVKFIAVLVALLSSLAFEAVRAGYAAAEGQRKNMVVVVDTSGSMKKVREEVHASLLTFLDGLDRGWRVILVRFDVFSEVLDQADMADQTDRERLKRKLETLRFVGQKTNFDEGIKGAQAALFQAGVVANADVVLFSDGLSDPSRPKEALDLVSLAQRVFPQQDGYNIYLLTVKPGTNPSQQNPTQGNVTTMNVSRENIPEVLAVIKRELSAETETPEVIPPAPVGVDHSTVSIGEPVVQESKRSWVFPALATLVLLLGVGAYLGREWLASLLLWNRSGRPVSLQIYGRRDTLREFWLSEGESLRIGGGICDYPLSTAATAVVTQQHGSLLVRPASPNSDVKLSGQTIHDSTLLPRDAAIVFDGHVCVEITQ